MPASPTSPAPLRPDHAIEDFESGTPSLDFWLKERALKAEARTARTYVTTVSGRVVGYYCFAAASVRRDELSKPLRRNMPEAVPAVLIGRLAVDRAWQGQGIGRALLRDVFMRALEASAILGSRGVLVHAIDPGAARFYEQYGFLPVPAAGSLTCFLPVETIAKALDG